MKFLLHWIERARPWFGPEGRLRRFFPIYEAGETFLFTPASVTRGAPHVRDALDIKRTMITVAVALVPCLLFGIFNAGYQYNTANQVADAGFLAHVFQGAWIVLPIVLVSYAVGGAWEVLFAMVRKHEINEGFLVTGLLFPLTLPPTIPLWQVAVGISFGIVLGKEIFGGTGFNVLNPALTARAFLFFAYPAQITGDRVWTVVRDRAETVAGFTGATPLAVAADVPAGASLGEALREAGFAWSDRAGGLIGGSIGETSLIPIALGALILVAGGVGAWRIMAGGLLGLAAASGLFGLFAGEAVRPFVGMGPHLHLAMGSVAFGLVFMATDPVSAAASNPGKWIYGFLIGALVVTVRVANPAFPEGVMLSILFMNVMAPLIDHAVLQAHLRARHRYLAGFGHA